MKTPCWLGLVVLGAGVGLGSLGGAGVIPLSQPPGPPGALPMTLESIRETRVANLAPDADAPDAEGSLELVYRVALPEGVRIALIHQPEKVAATDSEGTDLAKIPPDLFDRVQHLVFDEGFGDKPTIRLVLGRTARRAASVSVSLRAEAVTYQGSESFDVKRSDQWVPLEHASFAGMNASCRVVEDESGVRLSVRPPAARDWIEAVTPATPDAEPGGYSVSWDDESATFDVSPRPEAGQGVRVFVKAGLKTVPIEISEKARPLP